MVDSTAPAGLASRRGPARSANKYHWDKSTLEQRRRTRLQMLERENYTTLPEFENMLIAVENTATTSNTGLRRPGRPPRSGISTPKPNSSVVIIGSGDEGLKRANRKETRALAAQKMTFADALAAETDRAAVTPNLSSASYYYLTCIALPTRGSQPPPPRHFCSICGYEGIYTCVDCGMRYCSLACKSAHTDTRCLKHV
ncbi:hypothetical protein BX661DRAFT_187190, partial [Kickxella alabastrina]|uniref:uncharacterized protein n=1 Tax=Kickxella alabastrina TaxID=61397 RepID=UPI00221EF1C8